MSDSWRPHGLQQARPLFPLPSPRVHPSSCPLNQWCHSSSTTLFFFCLQSFRASGSFPVRRLFVSGGQSIGASASASVLPMNIQDLFPLGLTALIFLQSKGLSRVFSNELALRTRSPKYWSFSFSNSSSNEYSGLISFRINWPDLLEVQGTLKSLLQHHNLNASILQWSALFMVHLSYPYMTTGKNTTLTIQTFVSKMMSLLFNTLS